MADAAVMRRHYLNLSNGLEALYAVRISGEPWAVCRIRSTTIEHEDWTGLLMIDRRQDVLPGAGAGAPVRVEHAQLGRSARTPSCRRGTPDSTPARAAW